MSQYIRSGAEPNRRKQDVIKERLLGDCCEQLFNRWETPFAERIFKPAMETRRLDSQYGSWMTRFAVSLAWRTTYMWRSNLTGDDVKFLPRVDAAREHWRGYLLGEHNALNPYEHHIFLPATVTNHGDIDLPKNFHSYMLHAFDLSFMILDNRILAYTLLPGMVFVSSIHPPKLKGWQNTKILPKGRLAGPQRITDPVLGQFLLMRAKLQDELKLSPKQNDKIREEILRTIRSETDTTKLRKRAEALLADAGPARELLDEI